MCVYVWLTLHNDMYGFCHGSPQVVGGVAAVVAFVHVEGIVLLGSQRPGFVKLQPERLPVLQPAETTDKKRENFSSLQQQFKNELTACCVIA